MTGMGLTDISVLGTFHGNDSEGLDLNGTNTTVATEYLAAASLSNIWQSISSVVIWQGFAAALSVLAATAYVVARSSERSSFVRSAFCLSRLLFASVMIVV